MTGGVTPISRTSDYASKAASGARLATASETRGTVLVVDDDVSDLTLLQHILTSAGCLVEGVDSGREALARLARSRPDLVLLDVKMSDMDGVEVLRRIRSEASRVDLPVIMVTSCDQSADVVSALREGANDYVTKPVDIEVLLARVDTQIELRRLSRLREEFVGIASHDLGNSLSAISLGMDVLALELEGLATSTLVKEVLGVVADRADSMKRIVEDFLDLHAVDEQQFSLRIEPCDLALLATETVASLHGYAASKGITLEWEGATVPIVVSADASRIRQVLDNLAGNAIKFSDRGTRVRIRVVEEADAVRYEIQDQGPGLPVAEMGRLFTKYGRLGTRPTGDEKSSGMGLYICRRLVSLHGGDIGATNDPDGGAVFWFSLPRVH